ncbi:MAG: DinB family protein [Dehalococcoidia bacterium]
MYISPPEIALRRLTRVNELLLETVAGMYDEQASKWVCPTAPSAKWHLWHMARWSDLVQSMLVPVTSGESDLSDHGDQAWHALAIGDEWGFEDANPGKWGAGVGLDDNEAARLPLPETAKVVGYARSAFELAERRFAEVDDGMFDMVFWDWHDRETTVGDGLFSHIAHANRHLGMIEALRGVIGMRGTATE